MKVIDVAGTKKTGKTTLVIKIVQSLKRYGRVGTIKNMAHHPVDRGDTKRHFDAGADEVMGLGDARLKVSRDRGNLESSLAELEKDGMDYVVVEGFKQSMLPKIVMADIDVPNTLRKVRVSDINDDLIDDLTELILNLEDYHP
jgi:molybdopterin synthase catalytic subunit